MIFAWDNTMGAPRKEVMAGSVSIEGDFSAELER